MENTVGYDYWVDEKNNLMATDRRTGEVLPTVNIEIPVGSQIRTPQDQERIKEWKKLQEQKKQEEENKRKRRNVARKFGGHLFIAGNQNFSDLSPATAARMIYLSTFVGYTENGNRLCITQKRHMHKDDLSDLLSVSKATADRFLSEVAPKYVFEDKNGMLFLNEEFFVKGKLNRKNPFYRAYTHWIRLLYKSTPKNQHRYLGYVFQLLPHINVEYNVLCFNPLEKEFDMVEFMTLDEFCDEIGFAKDHRHRLLQIYNRIEFNVDDHKERFYSIISNGITKDNGKAHMFINPRIIYSGSQLDSVAVLGKFCKV